MYYIGKQFQYLEAHPRFPLLLKNILASEWTFRTHCSSIANTFPWGGDEHSKLWNNLDDELITTYGHLDEPYQNIYKHVVTHYTTTDYPELYL